jgi:hypothetical protein
MSKTVSKFAFMVGFVLAVAFTFSCSGDEGNESGGSPSSSGGTQGGVPDLPKQVYLVETGCCDDKGYYEKLLKKEPFNDNGDIVACLYLDSEKKGECNSISIGKIQGGQLSLNLPASVDSKYLVDWVVPCGDFDGYYYGYYYTNCENNISYVPENLVFSRIFLDAIIPGRSDCGLEARNPYLINSGESGKSRFYYFSESGRITGTETLTRPDDDGDSRRCSQRKYDMNFSKGWNFVSINYRDPNDLCYGDTYSALTTDLSKGGTWEWWLECYD